MMEKVLKQICAVVADEMRLSLITDSLLPTPSPFLKGWLPLSRPFILVRS